MKLSADARKLRHVIEKAMDDHTITKSEYDMIIHQALDDGQIDKQELALLKELLDMIANKTIKVMKD
ncbi:MAG: hypothetical protein JW973_17410 [Bacteroidales bacterium]|nr:hypothetical protein [Bacteroidales bacterium]